MRFIYEEFRLFERSFVKSYYEMIFKLINLSSIREINQFQTCQRYQIKNINQIIVHLLHRLSDKKIGVVEFTKVYLSQILVFNKFQKILARIYAKFA